MTDVKEIINALRYCSATGKDREKFKMSCENCKYRVLEEIDSKIPCPPDVEIDGKSYWQGCDCDKICQDAADMLEKYYK